MQNQMPEPSLHDEIRLLRQQVERTNTILVKQGVKVHVFWKIAWGIIMAGILLTMISVAWMFLMGATMLAGLVGTEYKEQQAAERYEQSIRDAAGPRLIEPEAPSTTR